MAGLAPAMSLLLKKDGRVRPVRDTSKPVWKA
jgi:hypothetical protein